MLSSARLLGQTTGAALVAVSFAFTESGGTGGAGRGALVALMVGAGFAGMGAVFSSLRLVRTGRN
jgi:hypothetical protein